VEIPEMTPRENILIAAAKLFQLKGYSATGLNEIISESGSPKGSLYYYFPHGKVQLATEAVEYAGAIINGHVAARLAEEPDPVKAFQRVIADIVVHFGEQDSEFEDVSLSMISLEASNEAEGLRDACQAVFDTREALFVGKLIESGYRKSQAKRLGALMQMLIEGAIVSTRTKNDTSALAAVGKYIPDLLAK
jgi:TetR/AcrR family transcriptional regulator, lmrAB and yxaGH operons repressor